MLCDGNKNPTFFIEKNREKIIQEYGIQILLASKAIKQQKTCLPAIAIAIVSTYAYIPKGLVI